MGKPLCVDLYCGLFGWGAAFVERGYRVVGFDIEDMHGKFGLPRPTEVELVLQDVLTLHGSQFRDAAIIVASPPCQEPSYRAMPWSRAKKLNELGPPHRFMELFNACFRIQREASEAAGRHVPMIVENVRGAQRWVGRAKWHYGSYYLWGDIPALMPFTSVGENKTECGPVPLGDLYRQTGIPSHCHITGTKRNPDGTNHPPGSWFKIADSKQRGVKMNGRRRERELRDGEFGWHKTVMADGTSKSEKRKAASARIAKIPIPLARHIAEVYYP